MTDTAATRIVMIGTGTPRPDPNRSGPATAIVVNDTPYLIDFGSGVIRRATAAYDKGVTALGFAGVNIKTAFLTHMHSDHTIGYPDLIFTPWTIGRHDPLEVYGPKGIKAMTEHVLKAWQVDTETRVNGVDPKNSTGCKANAHEITAGAIHQDRNVTVTAFSAQHATADSFSFRFDTPGRSIVISGDTSPTQALLDHSRGCDVLMPSGCAALFRRAMLEDTGGFDEDFFLYCEDTDLGLRARWRGWRSVYASDAVVTHRYSHSAGAASELKAFYVERNRLFVLARNFPARLLWKAPFSTLARYCWHLV